MTAAGDGARARREPLSRSRLRRLAVTLGAAGAASLLAACGLLPGSASPVPLTKHGRGGELRMYLGSSVGALDPQQVAPGADTSFAIRTYARTITTHPGAGVGLPTALAGDLAVSTGNPSADQRTWTFGLRSDALWQDSHPVTCQDIAYGISRNYGLPHPSVGGALAISLIDIPTAGGRSAYAGPWSGQGQALFDDAVTCAGSILTIRLKVPDPDFGEVAALPAFAAFRKDLDVHSADELASARFAVFSDGPFMLEGSWHEDTGGRFVRTRSWTGLEDPTREARVDSIRLVQGLDPMTALQRVIDSAGVDRTALTTVPAPPEVINQVAASSELTARTTSVDTMSVTYLQPRPGSSSASTPAVRQALSAALDRAAWVAAQGGSTAATPAYTVLPSEVTTTLTTAGTSSAPDPAAALAALRAAGVATPVHLTLAYPSDRATAAALAALTRTWQAGGLDVVAVPIPGDAAAYAAATGPGSSYDLALRSTDPVVPTPEAVLRPVLSATSDAATLTGAADAAQAMAVPSERLDAWYAIDARLLTEHAYLPLAQSRHVLLQGSAIDVAQNNALLGGWPDVATVALLQPDS